MIYLGKIVLMKKCLEMNKYLIKIDGCHDYTQFIIEVTPEEETFLKKFSTLSKNASEYKCQPIIDIRLIEN